jgi:hypothetical protein
MKITVTVEQNNAPAIEKSVDVSAADMTRIMTWMVGARGGTLIPGPFPPPVGPNLTPVSQTPPTNDDAVALWLQTWMAQTLGQQLTYERNLVIPVTVSAPA